MKQKMTVLMAAMALFLCMVPVASADLLAYEARAASVINWDTFSLTYTGTGGVIDDEFEAYAEISGEAPDWGELEAYVETATGFGYSETDRADTVFTGYQDLYAQAQTTEAPGIEHAYADAGYYGLFGAGTAGTLTLTVDYFLKIGIESTTSGVLSYSMAGVGVLLGDWYSDNYEENEDFIEFGAIDVMDYEEETPWRQISVSFDLAAGDIVPFEMVAFVNAATATVPVPGSFGLLLAGLLGVCFKKRRA